MGDSCAGEAGGRGPVHQDDGAAALERPEDEELVDQGRDEGEAARRRRRR